MLHAQCRALFVFCYFVFYAVSSFKGSTAPMHIPGLPPEFMQAIVHQISQQAATMATAASAGHHGHQSGTSAPNVPNGEAPGVPPPPQARVVITRPAFSPRIPQSASTRAPTINLRASMPHTTGQQPAQVSSFLRRLAVTRFVDVSACCIKLIESYKHSQFLH